MTILADVPVLVGRATAGTHLTPDEMLTRADALSTNPEADETFPAEMEDGYASRSSVIGLWIAPDQCREIALYHHDQVHSDGTVARIESVEISDPKPGEWGSFKAAIVALVRAAYAAGVADGQATA